MDSYHNVMCVHYIKKYNVLCMQLNIFNYRVFCNALNFTQKILGSEESKDLVMERSEIKTIPQFQIKFCQNFATSQKTLYTQRNKFPNLVKINSILIAITLFQSIWLAPNRIPLSPNQSEMCNIIPNLDYFNKIHKLNSENGLVP